MEIFRASPVLLLVALSACSFSVGPEVDVEGVAELQGTIVFQSRVAVGEGEPGFTKSEIFRLDLDAGRVIQITDSPGNKYDPVISPAGDRIAFSWESEGEQNIYLMDPNGTNVTQLTTGSYQKWHPSWSPLADRVAFGLRGSGPIVLINLDGSGRQEVGQSAHDPSWSPQGDRLAYTERPGLNAEIFSAGLDGEDVLKLTNHPSDDWSPSWSPDGRRIAFSRNADSFGKDVFVMNADGSGMEQLTDSSTTRWAGSPSWSPDGDMIVFAAEDGLYVVNADGTDQRQILMDRSAGAPDWW
jgi:Tol biopolymer transport system component